MEYEDVTIDHVVSLKDGGTQGDDNIIACCRGCNESKGHMNAEKFFSIRQDGLRDGAWPQGLKLHPTVVRLMVNERDHHE